MVSSGHPAWMLSGSSTVPSGDGAIAAPGCRHGMVDGLSAAWSEDALAGRDIASSPDPASRDHSLAMP